MEIKTVGIACDHAGYALKKFVVEYLESHNIPFKDYGTYSDMSCDYPDFAHALGEAITKGDVYPGIGICGSGEGMATMSPKSEVPSMKRMFSKSGREALTRLMTSVKLYSITS